MKAYLKFVNPVVALVVLILCVYSSVVDEGTFKPHDVVNGGLSTYFLAKGIFCSAALFLIGRILLTMSGSAEKP